jgi:hypothetical protein
MALEGHNCWSGTAMYLLATLKLMEACVMLIGKSGRPWHCFLLASKLMSGR